MPRSVCRLFSCSIHPSELGCKIRDPCVGRARPRCELRRAVVGRWISRRAELAVHRGAAGCMCLFRRNDGSAALRGERQLRRLPVRGRRRQRRQRRQWSHRRRRQWRWWSYRRQRHEPRRWLRRRRWARDGRRHGRYGDRWHVRRGTPIAAAVHGAAFGGRWRGQRPKRLIFRGRSPRVPAPERVLSSIATAKTSRESAGSC
jgi:hypothetical protein